jgi:cytochrome c oxidase subunit 2
MPFAPTLRLSLTLLFLAALAPPSLAQDLAAGERLYTPCAACHGRGGEGSRELHAPRIAGLPEWYVARQLKNFRTGLRGGDPSDVYGTQMARMALQLWDDGEVATVARYVGALPVTAPNRASGGKARRGAPAYAACATCHGTAAEGNAELGAPPLTGHDDWYVIAQLTAFRSGTRGAHERDTFGQQMRGASALLADAEQLADVAAYISTLGDRAERPGSRRRD